jgi:threonine/homoserine/homoserine lactone efflux protein
MPLLAFLIEAGTISLTGVVAPGPMTAVTLGKGSESPHAGALVAIGHGVVEFPLMVGIFYGLGALFDFPLVNVAVGLLGGVFLMFAAFGMFRRVGQVDTASTEQARSPLASGILLSLGNPYFLVWWATVGATLILRAVGYGTVGFVAFALLHWSCDFLWSYLLSILSFRGSRFFGKAFQRVAFAASGILLALFGGMYIVDALKTLI